MSRSKGPHNIATVVGAQQFAMICGESHPSSNSIARHFERFADGEETREQANQEIADDLLAFARQYSADNKTVAHP